MKATKRKKSGKRKRCAANRKCSENREVIGCCTVGHRERLNVDLMLDVFYSNIHVDCIIDF